MSKKWIAENREAWNEYIRNYHKNRMADPEYAEKRRQYARAYYRKRKKENEDEIAALKAKIAELENNRKDD